MFFSAGLERLSNLMNTHPPLLQRINRIQPGFQPRRKPTKDARTPQSALPEAARGFAADSSSELGASPEALVAAVGSPNSASLDRGCELLIGLPDELHSAAHDAFSARALVYALLLSPRPADRRRQLQAIQGIADSMTLQETFQVAPVVTAIAPEFRLPLLDLTLPALRNMSASQSRCFLTCVQALIDDEIQSGFFAVCLRRVLRHHLRGLLGTKPRTRSKLGRAADLTGDSALVLATIAHAGHVDPIAAQAAYADGINVLGLEIKESAMQPIVSCLPSSFENALDRLALSGSFRKRKLLLACAHSAASDGVIETAEAELLRAIADSFDCPMPPLRMGRRTVPESPEIARA